MKILAEKMRKFGILKAQMIISAIVLLIALIALPAAIIALDPSLLLNPVVLGIVIIGMLMFGLVAYLSSVRPYFIYRDSPDVLAETDGEYLYVHGKKEAKIPLSDLDGTSVFVHLPFLYSSELASVLVTHMLSDKYGDLDLDVPGYGSYKLRFVSNVQATADELLSFINNTLNNA